MKYTGISTTFIVEYASKLRTHRSPRSKGHLTPETLSKADGRTYWKLIPLAPVIADPLYCATHYNDVVMTAMASQITSLTVVHSIVYSDTDQRKHQSSALLAFARGIHQWPVNSQHKGSVARKRFPFDDVIMCLSTGEATVSNLGKWTTFCRTCLSTKSWKMYIVL